MFDNTEKRIRFQTKPNGTGLGIPAFCAAHEATITAHTVDEIVWEDAPYYCNWMIIGNSTNTFSFAVESVDFDRGIIGGYWTHAITGNGPGAASGYAVFVFPKTMPRGEDWLTEPLKN